MMSSTQLPRIGIIGGGPSALFVVKKLVDAGYACHIDIFETRERIGSGMPYSSAGAGIEHITNVSGNEIPALPLPVATWISRLPPEKLALYQIDPATFTEFKVLPRLLFGEYLTDQFERLQQAAAAKKITITTHLNNSVADIKDLPSSNTVTVTTAGRSNFEFDRVIICTGHQWPQENEDSANGYFESPYPPSKLQQRFNHPVALKGSALTSIDALRTLGRSNGRFVEKAPHRICFEPDAALPGFRIVMYSLMGLLPGIRFHLDDPRLAPESMLTSEEIDQHITDNGGFLSLDFIFDKDFKQIIKEKQPQFYEHIKYMRMEAFVDEMMSIREQADPFALFKAEYAEADRSIARKQSVYWKEMLSALSFAMNYPAKHFSAEDMIRLKTVLMPLISIVIAFVPQNSCEELLAMYEAGRLEIIPVEKDSEVERNPAGGVFYRHTDRAGIAHENKYDTYIDCTGQKQLSISAFPFKSMVKDGTISQARLPFRSADAAIALMQEGNKKVTGGADQKFYLEVPGIRISDSFRVVDNNGHDNARIYMMGVPFIGGYNPDYSGLDFCETAAGIIVKDITGQG